MTGSTDYDLKPPPPITVGQKELPFLFIKKKVLTMARDCIVYYLLFNQIQVTNSKKSVLRPRQEHCGKYENRNRKHLFKSLP